MFHELGDAICLSEAAGGEGVFKHLDLSFIFIYISKHMQML